MKTTFLGKSVLFVVASVMALGGLFMNASTAVAAANWNTSGSYVFAVNYLSTDYSHNVSLTQDGGDNLTGNGDSSGYTWVIDSGSVSEDAITFTAHYTATADAVTPLTIMNVNGTIAGDGSMSGTWSDNYNDGSRSGTWATTSGNAVAIPPSPTVEDCNASSFDSFTNGTVNGQGGWSVTGPYDQAIVDNTYGFSTLGCKILRISNAITSGSFGDQLFSPSTSNEAGETGAANGGFSGGDRNSRFEAQFDLASVSQTIQPDMSIDVSPDRGDGARMGLLRFTDNAGGIDVAYYNYQDNAPFGSLETPASGCAEEDDFVATPIATSLSRTSPHTIKLTIDFVNGSRNDVVKVYIDGTLVHTDTTWEDYYRWCTESGGGVPNDASADVSRTVDSLLIRARGTAMPTNSGNGFLFDNFDMTSVTDTTAPVITVLGENPQSSTLGATYTDAGATATDNIDGSVPVVTTGSVDINVPGAYVLTYTATDSSGNVATATRTVNVSNGGSGGSGGSTFGGSSTGPRVLGTTTTGTGGGQVLGAEKFNFTLFLKKGPPYHLAAWSNEVMELQKLLNALGFDSGPVDGKFGPLTEAAVIKFQLANGLKGDGIVGPLTRAALNK